MASKPIRLVVRFGDTKGEQLAQRRSGGRLPWWALLAAFASFLGALHWGLPRLK